MPNYQNAKIYKLWSPEGDDIYIGSTTQPLFARKAQHKKYNDCSAKILYEKYNDVRIELFEILHLHLGASLNFSLNALNSIYFGYKFYLRRKIEIILP
jgi:hypothetical protein